MTLNVKEVTYVLCFVKLILRKIIKTVATRCHILKLKCPKLISELIALPRPPSWIKGGLLLREGGRGRMGGKGKGGFTCIGM